MMSTKKRGGTFLSTAMRFVYAAPEGEARKQCFSFEFYVDYTVQDVNKKEGRRVHQEGINRRPIEKNITAKPWGGFKSHIDNPMHVVNKKKRAALPTMRDEPPHHNDTCRRFDDEPNIYSITTRRVVKFQKKKGDR